MLTQGLKDTFESPLPQGSLMRAKHRPVHDSSAEAALSQVLVTPEGWTTGVDKADTDSLPAGQQFSGPKQPRQAVPRGRGLQKPQAVSALERVLSEWPSPSSPKDSD